MVKGVRKMPPFRRQFNYFGFYATIFSPSFDFLASLSSSSIVKFLEFPQPLVEKKTKTVIYNNKQNSKINGAM